MAPSATFDSPVGGAAAHTHHGGKYEPEEYPDRTVSEAQTQQPVQSDSYGVGQEPRIQNRSHGMEVLCGPLLNYRRMSREHTDNPIWHGSALIVTTPGQQQQPQLRLRILRSQNDHEVLTGAASYTSSVRAEKLYENTKGAFWRFMIDVPFQTHESRWEYTVMNVIDGSQSKVGPGEPKQFSIPAKSQSMRIMFHSCNGFSVGTDTDAWSGCALWNDVLRMHEQKPFHVMIGGGDQIYNDGIRVEGPLRPWTDIGNPKKRRDYPFNEELRDRCDVYYFDNYVRWYSTKPFGTANAQIPQVNIWDDHDIIDGFGSYTDHFMRAPVFRGIGGVAHKYYLLFQHHLPPPKSTFTTDAKKTLSAQVDGTSGVDAVQLQNAWVKEAENQEPCYIIGRTPGPYVEERSRSIYCQLGARMAFLGIDARTERTRHQINYEETYDLIFQRAASEFAASKGALKHLILLLGVPIAYPRLQWLENILTSPIIGPIRLLNKRFGFAGGLFNQFDGGVDLMDDLDDHYTAHQHKKERKLLVQRLQKLAHEHSIRITILGGDVHLAALGRFYSNPKLNIKAENDWRYMANIVSSAITNKPPPTAVANLLARRNKIHHLDTETDETLLNMFDKNPGAGQPGVKAKTEDKNHSTMPSRNYAIIAESHDHPGFGSGYTNGANAASTNGHSNGMNGVSTNGHSNGMNGTSTNDYTNNSDIASTNGYTFANGMHEESTNGATSHDMHKPLPARPTTSTTNHTPDTTPNTHAPHTEAHHTLATHNPLTPSSRPDSAFAPSSNPRNALHVGESNAGTQHGAAGGLTATGLGGEDGLDVTIRVEINPADREGRTEGYGFSIPGLRVGGYKEAGRKW